MKTSSLIMLLALLLPIGCIAQNNSSFDFSFGAGSSFRSISQTNTSVISDSIFNTRGLEKRKLNLNIGMSYSKALTDKLLLSVGIHYSSYDYFTTTLKDLMWGSEHDGMGGWEPDPNLPHEIQNSVSRKFISLPVLLRYQINLDRFSPFVEFGPTANYYLTTVDSNSLNASSTNNRKKEDIAAVHIFGELGVGVNYNLRNKSQIFLLFRNSRQFNSIVTPHIKENLFDYGLRVGFRQIMAGTAASGS